jgi:hypothetical protein
MNTQEYLIRGRVLRDEGYETDGCSFVGWFVHKYWPHLEQACWSHDYGRRLLIDVEDQAENDNLFKDALRYLGAPRYIRTPMYWFTRLQGFLKDRFGMSAMHLFAILFLLLFLGIALKAHGGEVCRIEYTHDFKRTDETAISPDDLDYELWIGDTLHMTNTSGTSKRFLWYDTDTCPPCTEYRVRAVDTKMMLYSDFVIACKPPTQPTVCQ